MGRFSFPAGHYAYLGSALGGLRARLARHLAGGGKAHWHVDYLRPLAADVRAWALVGRERQECALAAALARQPGSSLAVPRFGSSDCRCPGHLVWLPGPPDKQLAALGLRPWPPTA
ncbi:MAG: GIY-YIG nuclease family protein [Chloroflexi bacterium]|nr:GIY-YIG nuclease family protein [Chloroflexota bacterium]MCL5109652.1 GIY-YIG nuclease family protein [Chloroflexota bacterium]